MSDTVLVGLIGAAALIVSTWMQRRPSKTQRDIRDLAQTAVEQTEKTGNGFAKKVVSELEALKKSSGALHRRLDQLSEIVVNFDGRITNMEEEDDNPPAPHLPQGDRRRPSSSGRGDWD